MARIVKPLTTKKIENTTQGNHFDGQGLYLEVTTKGKKLWRIKYKFNGKDKRKALGEYPIVDLKAARKKRENVLVALEDGLDPFAPGAESAQSFNFYAKEFMKNSKDLSDGHVKRIQYGWDSYLPDSFKDKAMDSITGGDIVKVLHPMRDKGIIDSGIKLFSSISNLFSWSMSNYPDIITNNPCGGLKMKHVLGEKKVKSYPSIPEKEPERIGKIMAALDTFDGFDSARRAIQLIVYTAVRPTNIQLAKWDEFDLEDEMRWNIPEDKMKTRKAHIVPLATQVVEMLKVWKSNSKSDYLFPSRNSNYSALNTASMIRVLEDIDSGLVSHSFRSVFSTFAHLHHKDKHAVIETQLAHSLGTAVSEVYNRALYIDDRAELMQWYADFVDGLRDAED